MIFTKSAAFLTSGIVEKNHRSKSWGLVVWWEFDGLVVDAMGDMIDVMVTIDHHAFQVVKVLP